MNSYYDSPEFFREQINVLSMLISTQNETVTYLLTEINEKIDKLTVRIDGIEEVVENLYHDGPSKN